MDLLTVVLAASILFGGTTERQRRTTTSKSAGIRECNYNLQHVEALVRHWAPMVWLAPGEQYFPSGVSEFLHHVTPRLNGVQSYRGTLPEGYSSESWHLVTKRSMDALIQDRTSFLHGTNPSISAVPVYALVSMCAIEPPRNTVDNDSNSLVSVPPFQVTYWMFYPYSQGKPVCMMDMGVFGTWPVPDISGWCLGTVREYGSHVGDWEHVSLMFWGGDAPVEMYVSTHDAGAYYRYNETARSFDYERQEARKGVLQRPIFPTRGNLTSVGGHPILFAARGSHGLWTAPGKHKYVKVARLYDEAGYGVPWATWKHIEVIYDSNEDYQECGTFRKMYPSWMKFRGRWGNPKSKCHPVVRLGLSACEFSDGPTGISQKKRNFKCSVD